MSEKKTYIMYKGWNPMLDALSDEDLGKIIHAIIAFQEGRESEVDNPLLKAMLNMILAQMRTDEVAYQEKCEARKLAGSKGGVAKSSNAKQNVANASNAKQNLANLADNDNENDNDNDIDKKNIKKKQSFSPPTTQEVKAYCEEKGYKIDAVRFVDFYESKGWMVGKNKMKDWKACVRTWSRSDQQEQRGVRPGNKFNNFDSNRGYDFEALEREGLGV